MQTECKLKLSLFGAPTLQLWDQARDTARPLPLCTQSRNLLAYLALARGGTRSRSELSQALADDAAEPAGAGRVNSAVWRLRQTLESPPFAPGELLYKRRDGQVGLRADAPLVIDVDTYLQCLLPALALPLDAIDDTAADCLRRGVALYAGDLLPGAHDDWVLREREKLRRHQINALGRLVQLSVRAGDAPGGIRHAEAILEIDEAREDVHRDLMRLFLLAGQRALALRQYERCREVLRRELSIVPMPETQTLYRQIAASAIERQAVTAPRSAGSPPADAPGSDLAELLASARRHLAAADAQLVRATPAPH